MSIFWMARELSFMEMKCAALKAGNLSGLRIVARLVATEPLTTCAAGMQDVEFRPDLLQISA
jgi:hypothetical protein